MLRELILLAQIKKKWFVGFCAIMKKGGYGIIIITIMMIIIIIIHFHIKIQRRNAVTSA